MSIRVKDLDEKSFKYLKDGNYEMHAFTIDSWLDSSDFVEDDSTFTSINYEDESGEDHSS